MNFSLSLLYWGIQDFAAPKILEWQQTNTHVPSKHGEGSGAELLQCLGVFGARILIQLVTGIGTSLKVGMSFGLDQSLVCLKY